MQSFTRLLFLLGIVYMVEALPVSGVHSSALSSRQSQVSPPSACTLVGPAPTPAAPSINPSDWTNLCGASGVSNASNLAISYLCYSLGQSAWGFALSAQADPCLQQNVADNMIFYAKGSGSSNSAGMISYAVTYRQLPRNASAAVGGVVPSNLYCTLPPANSELNGVVNAQPSGVSPGLYSNLNGSVVPFGANGTCPFGSTADTSTCSCSGNSSVSSVNPPSSTTNVTNGTTDTNSTATINSCDTTCSDTNSTATADSCATCSTSGNSTATGDCICDPSNSGNNSTLTGNNCNCTNTDSGSGNSTLTGSTLGSSNSTNGTSSTLTGNSTLSTSSSSNSTNGTDTPTSISTANSTLSTSSSSSGLINGTDGSGSTSSANSSFATASLASPASTTLVSNPTKRFNRARLLKY